MLDIWKGLNNKYNFAKKKKNSKSKIRCPCKQCDNHKFVSEASKCRNRSFIEKGVC